MSVLFLRIHNLSQHRSENSHIDWRLFTMQGQVLRQGTADTDSLQSVLAGISSETKSNAIVVLEGQAVLTGEVQVALRHIKHLRGAVAHSIEEQLAEPLEEMHIAISANEQDEPALGRRVQFAAISDFLISSLLQRLMEAGVVPSVMLSESMLLPYERGSGTLMLGEKTVLFRFGALTSSLEPVIFVAFLQKYFSQPDAQSEALSRIVLWVRPNAGPDQRSFIEQLHGICQDHKVELLVRHYQSAEIDQLYQWWISRESEHPRIINLLQPPYQLKRWVRAFTVNRRTLVKILQVWLVAQILLYAGEYIYLRYDAMQYHQKTVGIYQLFFPHDKVAHNMKAALQQYLRGEIGNAGMLSLLKIVATAPDVEKMEIERIAYDANGLTVEGTASNSEVFAALLNHLKAAGLVAESGTQEQAQGGVRNHISVRRP